MKPVSSSPPKKAPRSTKSMKAPRSTKSKSRRAPHGPHLPNVDDERLVYSLNNNAHFNYLFAKKAIRFYSGKLYNTRLKQKGLKRAREDLADAMGRIALFGPIFEACKNKHYT